MPRKHLKRRDDDEKTSWETKLQAASVAAAVAQAGHDQLLYGQLRGGALLA